jgi:ABC-2 type transport system ATP-binding protein
LLGPNGAGKSTLMRLVCGAIKPDSGLVVIGGQIASEARTKPGLIGWLPERAPLIAQLTVIEHLRLAAKLKGLGRVAAESEIGRLSRSLNLTANFNRLCGDLSLGFRRRTALAMALMGPPALMVRDEPSSSLDPDEVERLKAALRELPQWTSVLLSSHILSEVSVLTDLALFLNRGRLVASGPWESLPGGRGDPLKSYISAVSSTL